MRTSRTPWAPFALVALLLGGCGGGDGEGANAREPREAVKVSQFVVVETRPAVRETFSVTGDYGGEVRADRRAEVSADVAGRVLEVPVRMGDAVEVGAVLARLDRVPYEQRVRELEAAVEMARAQVREAKASIGRARDELKRKEPLLEAQLVTEMEIEQLRNTVATGHQQIALARARVTEAEARLETAREDLRRTVVRAPFAGRIDDRAVEVGSHVAPNERLFRIVSACDLYVRIAVPEQEATRIRVGEAALVRLDAVDGRAFAGHVLRTAPGLDPETRTLRVDVGLDDLTCPDEEAEVEADDVAAPTEGGEDTEAEVADEEAPPAVRPGMYARARIELGQAGDAVTVPGQALTETMDGAVRVWVVVDGAAEQRDVRRGLRGRERTQILEGVEPGESVVIRGQDKLRPGVEVRGLVRDDAPAPEGAR